MATALRHAGLPARLHAAGFIDIGVQPPAAPFRRPTRLHDLDFRRSAASQVIEILAP